MSDELDLDAIEARANAAPPGPWTQHGERAYWPQGIYGPTANITGITWDGGQTPESAWATSDFIAAAREDVPALVAELRAARAVITDLEAKRDAALAVYDEQVSMLNLNGQDWLVGPDEPRMVTCPDDDGIGSGVVGFALGRSDALFIARAPGALRKIHRALSGATEPAAGAET